MLAPLLRPGDVIGLASPSHVATPENYAGFIANLKARGFGVKPGPNLYKNTYGYLATEQERAEDINLLAWDKTVRMIFFGGGNGAPEVLPYLDYEAIGQNPKLFMSYSDGTSILNAVYTRTGLVTYYGQSPQFFAEPQPYDEAQFYAHCVTGGVERFVPNSRWQALHGGVAEGLLIGGYTENFALLMGGPYFTYDPRQRYILFLEDHERYSNPARVSALLSHVEQSGLIHCVAGLLFGHYSSQPCPELLARLARFGQRWGVPVIACDDFGHGQNHAILPIGMRACLNADANTLTYC